MNLPTGQELRFLRYINKNSSPHRSTQKS